MRGWKFIFLCILHIANSRSKGKVPSLIKRLVVQKENNPNIEWGTGMSADLDVTSDHDGNGYTLVITWDKPLSSFEQWSGSASSEDQK